MSLPLHSLNIIWEVNWVILLHFLVRQRCGNEMHQWKGLVIKQGSGLGEGCVPGVRQRPVSHFAV